MPNSTTDKEHLLHSPKLDTDQRVLRNTIKLYWDERDDKITSPLSAVGTTAMACNTCFPPKDTGKCFSNRLLAPNHFCLFRQQQESKGKEMYNKAELCHFRTTSDGTKSGEGIHSLPLDKK
jgi:hypothetical protein